MDPADLMAGSRDNGTALVVGAVALGAGVLLYKKFVPGIVHQVKVKQVTRQLRLYIADVKLTQDGVRFAIRIENPNSTPITVKALVGDVGVILNNGQLGTIKLGNVSKYGNNVIAATGSTAVVFDIKFNPIPLTGYFSLILAGKVSHQSLVFQGTINIDGKTYPVKETYRVS